MTTQTPKKVKISLSLLEQEPDWVDGILSLGRMDFLNQEEVEELNRLVPPNSVMIEKDIQYVLIEATDFSPSKIIEEAEVAGMKTTNLVEVICLIAEGCHIIPDKLYGEGQGWNRLPLILATDCKSSHLYAALVGADESLTLCFRYDKNELIDHDEEVWLLFRDNGTSAMAK